MKTDEHMITIKVTTYNTLLESEATLEALIERLKESNLCQTSSAQAWQSKANQLKAENERLKESLFVIGEIAVTDFDNTVVRIVDNTIRGFKVSLNRYKEILTELTKGKNYGKND